MEKRTLAVFPRINYKVIILGSLTLLGSLLPKEPSNPKRRVSKEVWTAELETLKPEISLLVLELSLTLESPFFT